jgi:hypothetical protein
VVVRPDEDELLQPSASMPDSAALESAMNEFDARGMVGL